MKKTTHPLVHLLAFAIAPLFVACAHGPAGEEVDGLAEATTEAPTLEEVNSVASLDQALEEAQEIPESQVVAAQKKVKKGQQKVLHPFNDPRTVVSHPTSAPAREELVVTPVDDTPKMMSQPVVRNGSTLNRYYFMRSGDSAESLSKLFYDSGDRAAELVEWNGPVAHWEAGKVIYYRSGKQADDTRLVSYYMEAGVKAEQVEMLPGDTLRTVASTRYGSQNSWREIASLNGMRYENDAPSNRTLKMYPKTWGTDAVVAQADKVQAMPNPSVEAPKTTKLASAGIGAFVQRHPIKVGGGIVALMVIAGLLFAQRRRQRSRFDF
jgi:hypothetical protein